MINLSKKQWGGALLVSLLALSLALAGCSEPEAVGSDITGTWGTSATGSTITSIDFVSDGTCTIAGSYSYGETPYPFSIDGTWSLSGTTVGIDASGDYYNIATFTTTQTYAYADGTNPTLTLKSGTVDATIIGGETETIPLSGITLQKSTN